MIYTAIIAGRDKARTDIQCFTTPMGFSTGRMNAKVYKILSHLFVKGPSIWVDGNIFPKVKEERMLEKLLQGYDIAAFKHPWRSTVDEEVQTIVELKLVEPPLAKSFRERFVDYLSEPLFECGVLVRADNERVRDFNLRWWALLNEFPPRDQITFPVAIKDVPHLRVRMLDADVRHHKYFDFQAHAAKGS